MGARRKKYDRNFKLQVVEKSYEVASIIELARELGIHPNLIYNWRSVLLKKKEESFPGEGNKAQSVEEAEIALLKKQLKDKELELEILKKAIGIFSKEGGKSINL
ncbi:MAG: transposase [Bacteroidota bacterium]